MRDFSNLLQNICRLFHFLAQFFFTSETELDYDHHKLNVRVASKVAESIKTEDLRKLQENPRKSWIWWQALKRPIKSLILMLFVKSRKKSAVKYSIERSILLNFVNLFTTFCPRLFCPKFNQRSRETIPLRGRLGGDQVKFLFFLKRFCLYLTLLFYLVQDSWIRLAMGYFYCIFRYKFVLVINSE